MPINKRKCITHAHSDLYTQLLYSGTNRVLVFPLDFVFLILKYQYQEELSIMLRIEYITFCSL